MLGRTSLHDELVARRVLVVVRGAEPSRLFECVKVLCDNGLPLVEISLTSTDALNVITRVATQFGDRLHVGAGTVLTEDDVQRASDAGAAYLVTPCAGSAVTAAVALGVDVLVGALTPSEVFAAYSAGATAVKLFPASLGGPGYVKAMLAPFPNIPLVPVGGIDVSSARDYLRAGALAVGVGAPLLGDAVAGGDLTALAQRVREWHAVVDGGLS